MHCRGGGGKKKKKERKDPNTPGGYQLSVPSAGMHMYVYIYIYLSMHVQPVQSGCLHTYSQLRECAAEAGEQVFSGRLTQVQMELAGSCCTWLHSTAAAPEGVGVGGCQGCWEWEQVSLQPRFPLVTKLLSAAFGGTFISLAGMISCMAAEHSCLSPSLSLSLIPSLCSISLLSAFIFA